jgi:spore coat polysaccharide biosynthesis predicted glycosyltransferase SpsG
MRCLALAQAWSDGGGAVEFLCIECPVPIEERLRSEGASVFRPAQEILRGSAADADWTARHCRDRATRLLVDGYAFDEPYMDVVCGHEWKVCQIDDGALLTRYEADLVLNQNGQASAESYASKKVRGRLLMGPAFTLLRREYLPFIGKKRLQASVATRLLVSMGGADPGNATSLIINALGAIQPPIEGLHVVVVAGPVNPHWSHLQSIAASLPITLELLRSVDDMARCIDSIDAAIIAGGTTLQELQFMGVPALVVEIVANQTAGIAFAHERHLAHSLGDVRQLTPALIAESVAAFLNNKTERGLVGNAGQRWIDGYGCSRVLNEMNLHES